MKDLIASHTHNIYLKPGEVVVARSPVLVSTVLGSCVAVTMYSPSCGVGAICHAMLPDSAGRDDLRYVDTALRHIYRKVTEYGAGHDLVVKLFGGAQVLNVADGGAPAKPTVGDQNVEKAEAILASLGLAVSASDTGGLRGRKLYFCTRDGNVYLRRMGHDCRSGKRR